MVKITGTPRCLFSLFHWLQFSLGYLFFWPVGAGLLPSLLWYLGFHRRTFQAPPPDCEAPPGVTHRILDGALLFVRTLQLTGSCRAVGSCERGHVGLSPPVWTDTAGKCCAKVAVPGAMVESAAWRSMQRHAVSWRPSHPWIPWTTFFHSLNL